MCAHLQGYDLIGITETCGMASKTGGLEWKGTGSLGRTGRGIEEEVSPSMSMTRWGAWSFTWGWMRSKLRTYGSGLNEALPTARSTTHCR